MNRYQRAAFPRAPWLLILTALGLILTVLSVASPGGSTKAAACDDVVADEACAAAEGPQVERQELSHRLFAIQVACDSCVLGGGSPSPAATATPTTPAATPTPTELAVTQTASVTATHTSTSTPAAATATPASTTPSPTSTPSSPPPGDDTCASSSAIIIAIYAATEPEGVTLFGSGNLSGWYLVSSTGGERYDFPPGYALNGVVDIVSGPAASGNPPQTLLWTNDEVWDDSGETASLFDCEGAFRGELAADGS